MVEVASDHADKHTYPMKVNTLEIQVEKETEKVMRQQVCTVAF